MTQADFLNQIARLLEAAGIPFMVVGSHASSFHGLYRATQDVDIVIDPTREQLSRFVTSLGDEIYVSPEAAQRAQPPFDVQHHPFRGRHESRFDRFEKSAV